jgi:2-beta-glucuronyltransferase
MPERSGPRRRVVLVSGHYLGSQRRAGFHWLADAYLAQGWEVVFVTASLSWLSYVRRDHRLQYHPRKAANRLVWQQEHLAHYVWFTPWHPANLRLGALNRLTSSTFARYGDLPMPQAEEIFGPASLVIVESFPGIMLVPRIRRLAPAARLVYRVSDDLRLLDSHPTVLAAEAEVVGDVDLVSTPSHYLLDKFSGRPHAQLHFHGVRKDLFDSPSASPYTGGGPHAVFVGTAFLDVDFLRAAAAARPGWTFHIIGPFRALPTAPNVLAYGEIPFAQTVPYLQHADVGLHTLSRQPGVESFTDTLKVLQYTYCRLPIVAPSYLRSDRRHLFLYDLAVPESVPEALDAAAAFDRSTIDRSAITTWDELAVVLAEG